MAASPLKCETSDSSWTVDADVAAGCMTLDLQPHREAVYRWRCLPECKEFVGARRSKHTMVTYNQALYVFGGDNGRQMLSDMIRYDPRDHSWGRAFTVGQMPAPRYHHSAVVYEKKMYIFGGYTGDIHSNSNLANKNDLFEYRFQTGQWVEIKAVNSSSASSSTPALSENTGLLPPARSAHGTAVYGGFMYIFGGFDGNSRLNDMWRIKLNGPIYRWEEIKPRGEAPAPCCNFPTAVIQQCMYLFSGQSGARSTNALFEFNFETHEWQRLSSEHILRGCAPPPDRRYGHTMVAHDRQLYLFGGAADQIYGSDVHCYDLDTATWAVIRTAPLSQIPAGRLFHSACIVDHSMYVFGGTIDNNVRSGEMYRLQLASYPRCTLHEDFGRLLTGRQFCDLKFLVGPTRDAVYAHIAIVTARSDHLRDLIRQAIAKRDAGAREEAAQQEDSGMLEIELTGAHRRPFEMVLDYIYSDKIDPTDDETVDCDIVLTMMDVYKLALNLKMKHLESLCVQYLESMIVLSNVLPALQKCSRLRLDYIKEYCLKFITKETNYNHIVMTKQFETLEQPLMVEIIRRRQQPPSRQSNEGSAGARGSRLVDDLRTFLETNIGAEFCDLTLICHGESVRVHKVILAARSSYFEAMFRSFMPETNTVSLSLGHVVPSLHAFRSLLKYIYYGCTSMPPEDSLFLFSAPSFYGFSNNRLQVFCKENLETNIRTSNILDVLEAADYIQSGDMKRHALSLCVENFQRVASQPKLHSLSRELLLDIITALAQTLSLPGAGLSPNSTMTTNSEIMLLNNSHATDTEDESGVDVASV